MITFAVPAPQPHNTFEAVKHLWDVYTASPSMGAFIGGAERLYPQTPREHFELIWHGFDRASSERRKEASNG